MKTEDYLRPIEQMKIRDLVILVKYAQGLILFDSYIRFVRFLTPKERLAYFSHIAWLIDNINSNEQDVFDAVKISGLPDTCVPCLAIEAGINEVTLKQVREYSEVNLESSTKLLLSLFTIRYQRLYRDNRNDPERFWYWDFADVDNTLKLISRYDSENTIDISRF